MKKILASLFVASVTICSASAANSQVSIPPAVSVHTGNIPASCQFSDGTSGSISATPGTLVANSSSVPTTLSSDSTGNRGSFTVICNSTHTFRAELIAGVSPTIPNGSTYSTMYRLIPPSPSTSPYSGITTNGFTNNSFSLGSLPATSINGYVVGVAAEASITPGSLPVGLYRINIQATVTAN